MNDWNETEREITQIIAKSCITNCAEKMPAAAAHLIRLYFENKGFTRPLFTKEEIQETFDNFGNG